MWVFSWQANLQLEWCTSRAWLEEGREQTLQLTCYCLASQASIYSDIKSEISYYTPGYNIICQDFSKPQTRSINYNLGFQYFLDRHDHQNSDRCLGKTIHFKIHKIWAFLVFKFLPQIRNAFEFR